MRQRKMDALATQGGGNLSCPSTVTQFGSLSGPAYHLHVLPGNSAAQTRADGFHPGLLGGEARGQALGGVRLAIAVSRLFSSEYTVQKAFAIALHRPLDSRYLDDVNA